MQCLEHKWPVIINPRELTERLNSWNALANHKMRWSNPVTRNELTFDVVKQRLAKLLNEENTPRSHLITAVFLLGVKSTQI